MNASNSTNFFQFVIARALFVPSVIWNLILVRFGYRNFCDRIDSSLILGALPITWIFSRIRKRENISAMVAVNEDYELRYGVFNQQRALAMDIQHLHLRCTDFFAAPSLTQIKLAINFIRRVKELDSSGGSVYVHCKAGRSRSSCIVACYLMQEQNLSAKEAVAFIRSKRPHIAIYSRHWEVLMRFQHEVMEEAARKRSSTSVPDT